MPITRLAKVLLAAAVGFYLALVVFNNLTDYGSNYVFIQHVLAMDTTFPGNAGMRGNSAITGGQLDNLRNTIFPSPLLDYKERGTKVTLGAKDKVGDRDVLALSITPASGAPVRLFVDAQTYLPAKTILTTEVPEVGPVEQSTEFSDFREVDGVKVPFKLRITSSVQSSTVTVTKVEHNVKIDPALFVKPADK